MGFARVGSNPTVVDIFLCAVRRWLQVCPCGAMDSASDFGSGGWGFESPQGLCGITIFVFFWPPILVFGLCPLDWRVVASLAEWLRRWL
jgi:hypothetical protein